MCWRGWRDIMTTASPTTVLFEHDNSLCISQARGTIIIMIALLPPSADTLLLFRSWYDGGAQLGNNDDAVAEYECLHQ